MSTTIRNRKQFNVILCRADIYIYIYYPSFARKYSNITRYARGQTVNGSRAFINGSVVSTENQPASSRSGQMTARFSWYNDIFFLLTRGQSQVRFSISSPRPLYFSFFYEPYVIEAFRASLSSNKRKPTGIQSTTGHI